MDKPLPTIEGPTPTISEPTFAPEVFTHRLAIVLDNVVQDLMFVQPRSAAIFLSEPLIIDVTHLPTIQPGYIYNPTSNSFKPVVQNPTE